MTRLKIIRVCFPVVFTKEYLFWVEAPIIKPGPGRFLGTKGIGYCPFITAGPTFHNRFCPDLKAEQFQD
jgi:hypothetical protein